MNRTTHSKLFSPLAGALALAPLLVLLGSCDFSEYCLNCDSIDAAATDAAQIDSSDIDACSMTDEICDGLDNDCDNLVDENPEMLPEVGDACGTNAGECTEGVLACESGALTCAGASPPNIEVCDGLDNDCNGITDDNTMEAGQICGDNTGECRSGLTACDNAAVICQGSIDPVPELCDGLDNDCDNALDEMIPPGAACGPVSDLGECTFGQETCVGGTIQCVGSVFPSIEVCDALDHDCDGMNTNGFDLAGDINNCGTCGHVCADDISAMDPHVQALECDSGMCGIAACETGYYDLDGMFSNGCEYACSYQGEEVCNLADDDCDGMADEGIMPPGNYCSNQGACADPTQLTPICTAMGWYCDYENERPNVEVDANGGIAAETFCDDYDNDCDGAIDEGDPNKGGGCAEGMPGICQSTGIYACNVDPAADLDCIIDTPGLPMGTETCNALDDDCDGITDEAPSMGGDINQWVSLTSGVEVFAYEASRPDATDTLAGNINGAIPCSKANVKPWTNVRYPEAKAACEALGGGARLCTEADWAYACEGPTVSSPVQQDAGGTAIIEAEWYDNHVSQGGHDWLFRNEEQGYARAGYMQALPDTGTNNDDVEALTMSPRLDYQVDFAVTGTHYAWVYGYAPNSNGNRFHLGFDGVVVDDEFGTFSTSDWEWEEGRNSAYATFNVPTTGVHTVNVWMQKDGLRIDRIVIFNSMTPEPDGLGPQEFGCTWAYGSSCDTYSANTCNGLDYDTDSGQAGDQNDILPTGTMAACYADWGGAGQIYDLSGNVKEWTLARSSGVNPIRGGSSNNAAGGLSCQYDFTAADDSFLFPNVGFRCCR